MRKRREAVIDLYNLALGALLFASPWLFALSKPAARLDAWIAGGLLIAASLAAVVAFSEWEEWLSLLLGAWLIVSPWALGFAHSHAMHVVVVLGCVVLYLAALELWLVHNPDYDEPVRRHGASV